MEHWHPKPNGNVVAEAPYVLFVVLQEGDDERWLVQAVPVALGSKQLRRSLPQSWSGLDGAAFAAHTGVMDATFVHRGLFICGARTPLGALKLAELALKA